MFIKKLVLLAVFGCFLAANAQAQITPEEVRDQMGRGINLGNTLEPPVEGGWNTGPAQEYYFEDYKNAGFQTVRVPVRWETHTDDAAPFAVDSTWMNRVEEVIDWGLAQGLFIILNAHHEENFKEDYEGDKEKFDSIWTQIAERFKDKDEKLLFEMINEPLGLTVDELNEFNKRTLGIIRATNPTRVVIYCGNKWSNSAELIDPDLEIPDSTDQYLMGYYHSYDPYQFGLEGKGTWGTDSDKKSRDDQFKSVADWSTASGIPAMISEFGAVNSGDLNSRYRYYASITEKAISYNIPFQVWDDGGWFRIYEREDRGWNEFKDILIYTYPNSPTNFEVSQTGSDINIVWENRATTADSLHLQRKPEGDSLYSKLATLSASTNSYTDSSPITGINHYRVLAYVGDTVMYSYPQFQYVIDSYEQTPYGGTAWPVPGKIQAENYDEGEEGVAYHDVTPGNSGGQYREDWVDITGNSFGGSVTAIISGEWLEYTINVATAGTYDVAVTYSSTGGTGKIHFENEAGEAIGSTSYLNQMKTEDTLTGLALDSGEQVIRLVFEKGDFEINHFTFFESTTSVLEFKSAAAGFAYDAQTGTLNFTKETSFAIFNARGELQFKGTQNQYRMNGLNKGVYFVKTVDNISPILW